MAAMAIFALFMVAWLLGATAVVTGWLSLLVVAGPCLVVFAIRLMNQAAWERLLSSSLATSMYPADYLDRVRANDTLRRSVSAAALAIGVIWSAVGLLT